MSLIDKKLLQVSPLNNDATHYLFEELYKHVQTTTLLATATAIVLMLFELERPATIMLWLLPMCVLQAIRYTIANKAIANTASNIRTLFLRTDYLTTLWWVAYIYIFGWQTTSTFDYALRTFMVYIIITFYLNVMRFHLPNLAVNSAIVCFGILIYTSMFTQLPTDFKWEMSLLTIFGLFALLFFGRLSNLLACEAYQLIKENKQLIHKMDILLTEDELTHQPNRRYFNCALSKHLMLSKLTHQTFSLAILDIDFFKRVNDTYGHDIGDEVLISIGKFIRHQIRNSDIFARYGGEEFVIIFPASKQVAAKQILDKVRISCANHHFKIDALQLQLTISIGITEVEQGDDEASIIKRADKALYEAKNNGRNRIEVVQTNTR